MFVRDIVKFDLTDSENRESSSSEPLEVILIPAALQNPTRLSHAKGPIDLQRISHADQRHTANWMDSEK